MQLLGEQVHHQPVAVVDQDALGTRRQRPLDGRVRLGRHQPAEPIILCGMPRIDRIGLVLVDDAGHAFHVDGDVDPHGCSQVRDRVQGTVENE